MFLLEKTKISLRRGKLHPLPQIGVANEGPHFQGFPLLAEAVTG